MDALPGGLTAMWNHVLVYFSEIVNHWIAIVTGSAVSLFILIKEHRSQTPVKWKIIVTIFVAGCLLAMFFAWQNEYTSAEWRGGEIERLTAAIQAQQAQIQNLQTLVAQKDRPIILQQQTDPAILKLVERQDAELARLKSEIPSPRKKALQLSNDILKFLGERQKDEPTFQFSPTTTTDEWNQHMQQERQAYTAWMNQTAAESRERFALRVADVLEDAKENGIDTSRIQGICEFYNGNTFALQTCGVNIGSLARQLPQ